MPSAYRQERAALVMLYAAKIAAARLYAPKHELAAIEAAIRAEEYAALTALRERRQLEVERKRKHKFSWGMAARGVTRGTGVSNPGRPHRRIHRNRKRDRQHG